VERSQPGELHDRAAVNQRNAQARSSEAEQAESERRPQRWREVFVGGGMGGDQP